MTARKLFLSTLLIVATHAQAAIWVNQAQWDAGQEAAYSRWVTLNWSKNFFADKQLEGAPNPFYGIHADCADTVYSMRFVYSFLRRLPWAIKDPTSKRLLTNDMTRFDRYPTEEQRAAAMLKILGDIVSTNTMENDTFPVALARGAIRPGGMILTTHANHHSWSIKDILETGIPWLVFNSTVGRNSGIVLQERKSWPHGDWVFEGDATVKGRAGIRDWRPIPYLLGSVWDVPGFSEEQYNVGPARWAKMAQAALQNRRESDDETLSRLAKDACADLIQRVSAVKEGVDYLRQSNYACMDSANFDEYSTPSRDHRFFQSLADLRRAYVKMVKKGSAIDPKLQDQISKVFPYAKLSARDEMIKMNDPRHVDARSLCPVGYGGSAKIDLAEAKRRLFASTLSSNPMDDLAYRWGEIAGPSGPAASCPAPAMWTPNIDEAD